jgi:hypothetical protein
MEIARVVAQGNVVVAQGHVQAPLRFFKETLLVTAGLRNWRFSG